MVPEPGFLEVQLLQKLCYAAQSQVALGSTNEMEVSTEMTETGIRAW